MLGREGIEVSVICPGYVKSRMTEKNDFPMPFLMTAERAAAILRRGLAANRARLVFPRPPYALVWLLALLPPGWTDPLMIRLPEQSSCGGCQAGSLRSTPTGQQQIPLLNCQVIENDRN